MPYDSDTPAVVIGLPGAGGTVAGGTLANPLQVAVTSMPAIEVAPAVGGATEAAQVTGNASLASVDGKLPALVGGRLPVVLPTGAGGLTDTELRATALPVSIVGSSVTLNVDDLSGVDVTDRAARLLGHVAVDSLPTGLATEATLATLATDAGLASVYARLADGTVRGTVAVSNLPATQAVSGTFWQATQPVSIAATVPVSGPLTDAQIRATALPVSGTVTATGPLTDAQLRAASVPVQVKDSGRLRCVFTWNATTNVIADTLLLLSKNLDGTVTTGTTHAVTAGKRLRITAVAFSLRSGAAAAAFATMHLRSLKGAVLVNSPALLRLDLGNTAATIGAADKVTMQIPDGFEFAGTDQLGVSLACQAVTNIVGITLAGYEYTP